MPDVQFKDLCIDVLDVARAGRFYAPLLGLALDPDRPGRLVGTQPEQAVWLNAVPEPKLAKNRVHLDVHVAALDEPPALGATQRESFEHWTVFADPEGQEFCAFVRQQPPAYRMYELVVDAVQPDRTARWWADRFGVPPVNDGEVWWVQDAPGLAYPLVFVPVPEPKTVKNRVHWDVWGDPETLVRSGARVLRQHDDEIGWDVLADPEGNEFCLFAPSSHAHS